MTKKTDRPNRPNRLAQETSPYLQQHSHNPVDWYPWGEEALAKAKRDQKPIFLSIGYSACHWCHVMEHESFEDEETAKLMNQSFVNIKVDREERPDLDHIYMGAVQAMTQHGGWPMSVFLTPDLEPFYGGTYFPKDDRMGMPSFKKILTGVANTWSSRREEVTRSAKELTGALAEINTHTPAEIVKAPTLELVDAAILAIGRGFDITNGGFGSAPKFFHSMNLKLCLRQWLRNKNPTALGMVTLTLDHWARGGIYDQLGGGFHRYSTDARWLAPHFEKMLYDNALLAEVYLEGYQATHNSDFAQVARETLDYVLREMTSPEGGFYSTQDADSEGVEGKFYVWTRDQIFQALDKDVAEQFCRVFDVTERGNWEEHSILNRPHPLEEDAKALGIDRSWLEETLSVGKRKLFSERAKRIAPFRDEKVLTSWNAMMIESMAKGYQVLGDERYLAAAKSAADFILQKMQTDYRLVHVYKDGRARLNAYLDDYAGLINALVSLYESEFETRWLTAAAGLTQTMLDQFWDEEHPSFFLTGKDHEKLITRPKDVHDGATPSGASIAVLALIRVGKLLGNYDWMRKAEQALQEVEELMRLIPTGATQFLVDLDMLLNRPQEFVVIGGDSREDNENALRLIRDKFAPNKIIAFAQQTDARRLANEIPLFKDRQAVDGKVTLYLCENFACQVPLVGLSAIESELKR